MSQGECYCSSPDAGQGAASQAEPISGSVFDGLGEPVAATPSLPEETEKAPFEQRRDAWLAAVQNEARRLHVSPDIDLNQADIRFSTSLPLAAVRERTVAIVGVGAIGNALWRAILGMGFRSLALYDDDTVAVENIGPQGHNITDLGLPKVEAARQAALAYRGIEVLARNQRVYTLGEIAEDLGYVPDIVITCTDSTRFRNGFIDDLRTRMQQHGEHVSGTQAQIREAARQSLPELLLDFRMALGAWNCYAIPCRAMSDMLLPLLRELWNAYTKEAVFEPEEAVQEPCTERSIAYTGANTASYAGAFLHWWLTKGRSDLRNESRLTAYFGLSTSTAVTACDFRMLMSFDVRQWEQNTATPTETLLRRKLAALQEGMREREMDLARFISRKLCRDLHVIPLADVRPGDYLYTINGYWRCVTDNGMTPAMPATEFRIVSVPGTGLISRLDQKDVILALRPDREMGVDLAFTAVPGETWLRGVYRNVEGRDQTVWGQLRDSGDKLSVDGINLFKLTDLRIIDPAAADEIPAGDAVDEAHVAEGDIVILPRISSESITYTVVAKREEGLMVNPNNELSEPCLVSRRHLDGMRRISRTSPATPA